MDESCHGRLAVALLGTANLLDRPWTLLAIPAMVVIVVLAVRIFMRLIQEDRSLALEATLAHVRDSTSAHSATAARASKQ